MTGAAESAVNPRLAYREVDDMASTYSQTTTKSTTSIRREYLAKEIPDAIANMLPGEAWQALGLSGYGEVPSWILKFTTMEMRLKVIATAADRIERGDTVSGINDKIMDDRMSVDAPNFNVPVRGKDVGLQREAVARRYASNVAGTQPVTSRLSVWEQKPSTITSSSTPQTTYYAPLRKDGPTTLGQGTGHSPPEYPFTETRRLMRCRGLHSSSTTRNFALTMIRLLSP